MRADGLLAHGDVDGFAAWKRVATVINELDRVTTRMGRREKPLAPFESHSVAHRYDAFYLNVWANLFPLLVPGY